MGQFILNGRNYSGITYANGCFIDTDNVIKSITTFRDSMSYTATEDCFIGIYLVGTAGSDVAIRINNKWVTAYYYNATLGDGLGYPLKKGQTISISGATSQYDSSYAVYGIQEGSPVTFLSEYASAVYDTTEREVGCWVDGKPIYQITTRLGAISANASSAFVVGIGANVVETVVSYNVIAYVSSGAWVNLPQPLPSNISSYASYVDNYNKANDTINIITGADRDFSDAFVTVQYTKTTDVAGSGKLTTTGMPTVHYDGNERVIGTWFGETLYEKTIHIVEQSEQTNKNYTAEITSLNASHIKLKNAEVKLGSNGGNAWYTAPFWHDGSYNMCVAVSPNDMNIFSRGWQYTEAYVTLQYTKSS